MTHFQTQFNFDEASPENYEYPTGVSLTIPNQVLSPKEMLERFSHGLPLETTSQTPYYSEIELPNLQKLDLTELHDLYTENKSKLDDHKANQEKAKQKQEKELLKQHLKQEIENEQKEKID